MVCSTYTFLLPIPGQATKTIPKMPYRTHPLLLIIPSTLLAMFYFAVQKRSNRMDKLQQTSRPRQEWVDVRS